MITKQELRQQIRLRKQQSCPADESVAIIGHLKQEKHIIQAHTLLLYSALSDEVQTQDFRDELVSKGKKVLLPRVLNSTEMELRHYSGRQDLEQGAFGIMEPIGDVFTDYRKIDVAIIPGIAFDTQGHRLGRGRGYYDRFLSGLSNTVYKIGVCFPWQIVDAVPVDDNDIPMDIVIY